MLSFAVFSIHDSKRRPELADAGTGVPGDGIAGRAVTLGPDVASMMQGSLAEPLAAPDYCVTSRRNDSLGSKGRWRIFAALCGVSFGLALTFAALGAWPVLPYSGLEMGVLFWAFRWLERHAADWEKVSVHGDRVIVERQRAGVLTRREFNRFWTRLLTICRHRRIYHP